MKITKKLMKYFVFDIFTICELEIMIICFNVGVLYVVWKFIRGHLFEFY